MKHLAGGVALGMLACASALAANYVDDPDIDPVIRAWYQNAMRSDQDSSCCGSADAFWADKVEVKDGKVYATITDDRMIPGRVKRNGKRFAIPDVVNDKRRLGNPTGHTVVFISGSDIVICFFQATGG